MSLPRTALVLGGSSEIALAVLRRLSTAGLDRAVLACREPDSLATQLTAHPIGLPSDAVTLTQWDALDLDAHERLLERAGEVLGSIDLVLCAVGSLGHGAGMSAGPADAFAIIEANFTGPAAVLTVAAAILRRQRSGAIVVLSSVAGLRARRSNYLYGSAKAGLDAFTCGLSDALAGTDVRVHLVRPGFVHTRMTAGLAPAPFASQPDAVADAIVGALGRSKSSIVHVPRLLGPLFVGLRAAPRPIWRRIAGDR